ncbi:hypothetical protein NG54_03260 [Heyndrickxia ginsengihumi]|uniref:Uncharacterized protein n=1 Tax=Heyndrickxia ginsengihumi TaxID=363870 RepID=A0A0A6VFK7_9BACI|nr:hypothetical protein NG54_03260 [Heyndrickxia ginsengihumi]
MCDVCNGRHVVYGYTRFGTMIQPCPNCNPKPKEQYEQEYQERMKRFELAKARFSKEVIPC